MPFRLRSLACTITLLGLCAGISFSKLQQPPTDDEPQSLKKFRDPKPIPNDPLAKEFSMEKAIGALDSASLKWTTKQKCFACHTNISYFYARPLYSPTDPAATDMRKALQSHFEDKNKGRGWPRDFFLVSVATSMAFNDAMVTKKLDPLTKQALDQMWGAQGGDGSLQWGGGVVPVGSRTFGAAIGAIAVAGAPEGYAETEAGKKGLERLRNYLKNTSGKMIYDKAMTLWASKYVDGILTTEQKEAIVQELRNQQAADGSWALAKLADGKQNKKEPTVFVGDGYATGLAILAMRMAGVPTDDAAIVKGVAWLKSNQLESGRWPTTSIARDNSSVLTNTGTVFAILGLHSASEPAIR